LSANGVAEGADGCAALGVSFKPGNALAHEESQDPVIWLWFIVVPHVSFLPPKVVESPIRNGKGTTK